MGSKANQHMNGHSSWLQMLRISNSPTIVSNAMVGVSLALVLHQDSWSSTIHPPPLTFVKPLVIIMISLMLMYLAGMVLNDVFDAERDKKTKPSRPIPSGVISKKHAITVGVSMLAIGAFLPLTINVPAGLACISLAISIVLYTILHHKLLPAILLMGICRGLVYIATLLACFQNPPAETPALFACAIALYTILLTLIGRIETSDFHAASWLAWLAPLPIMTVLLVQGTQSPISWFMFVCLATLCGLAWNDLREKNKNIVAGMHKLLAGFAIVDCVLIASLNENVIMLISIFCFVLTVAAHRKILGT